MTASNETTTWIAHTLRLLLCDPASRPAARAASASTTPLTRCCGATRRCTNMPARYALRDTELGGQRIRRGDMRSSSAWPRPTTTRGSAARRGDRSRQPRPPGLLGAGPHVCPAQVPARLITRTAVETVRRLPGLRLTVPPRRSARRPSPWTRGPAALPVAFPPAPRPSGEPVTTTPDAAVPEITLDPYGSDHHAEAARLRALGPVVRVRLPGDVRAWAVIRHELLAELLADPHVSKDWRNWTAIRDGEIADGWPLIAMVKVPDMITADGADHRRLRKLVSRPSPRAGWRAAAPRSRRSSPDCSTSCPSQARGRRRGRPAPALRLPLPMGVICELLGVAGHEQHDRLHELSDSIVATDIGPEEVTAANRELYRLLARVAAARRAEPGDDLTSALIAAREDDGDRLSRGGAGRHPAADDRRRARDHPEPRSPTPSAPCAPTATSWPSSGRARRAGRRGRGDAALGRAGQLLPVPLPAGGRRPSAARIPAGHADPRRLLGRRPRPGRARAGRRPLRHHPRAAPPSLLRPRRALLPGRAAGPAGGHHRPPRLFARYPGLSLAVDPATLTPVPSMFSNSSATLPVRLAHDT